jgi:hypothetical protein
VVPWGDHSHAWYRSQRAVMMSRTVSVIGGKMQHLDSFHVARASVLSSPVLPVKSPNLVVMNLMSCFFLVLGFEHNNNVMQKERDTLAIYYQFSTLRSSDIIYANGEFAG